MAPSRAHPSGWIHSSRRASSASKAKARHRDASSVPSTTIDRISSAITQARLWLLRGSCSTLAERNRPWAMRLAVSDRSHASSWKPAGRSASDATQLTVRIATFMGDIQCIPISTGLASIQSAIWVCTSLM